MGSSADGAAARFAVQAIDGPSGRLRVGLLRSRTELLGTLVLLPGRGEFMEKYEATLAEIAGWGLAVATLDWRGQGGSHRLLGHARKGHVADFTHFLDDLDALLSWLRAVGAPPARLAIGHSMGGHILLRALAERATGIERAALVAPMLDIDLGAVPWPIARVLARSVCALGLGGKWAPGQKPTDPDTLRFAGNRITTDEASFERWRALLAAHPDLRLGGVTYGWLDAALRSIARIRRPGYLKAIDAPVLIAMAGEERIVRNEAIRAAARRLPHCELVAFEAARHDLFQEAAPIRAALLAAIRRTLTVPR